MMLREAIVRRYVFMFSWGSFVLNIVSSSFWDQVIICDPLLHELTAHSFVVSALIEVSFVRNVLEVKPNSKSLGVSSNFTFYCTRFENCIIHT